MGRSWRNTFHRADAKETEAAFGDHLRSGSLSSSVVRGRGSNSFS